MSALIPTGTPKLDAAIREEAERRSREHWTAACEVASRFGFVDEGEPDMEIARDTWIELLRDLTRPASYDAAKRLLARMLGCDGVEVRWGPDRGDVGRMWGGPIWCLWVDDALVVSFFPRRHRASGSTFRVLPEIYEIADPRQALIAALVSVGGA